MKAIPFTRLWFILLLVIISCSSNREQEGLLIRHQVTGLGETNCYLIYDQKSKEAAFIDVGGPVDSLVNHMQKERLRLKYIFATHCHFDHIEGVPDLRQAYPDALLCFNKEDFQDFMDAPEWVEKNLTPAEFEEIKQDPLLKKWIEFDPSALGKIDVHLEDKQAYSLGDYKIETFITPGHSRGSICFLAGNNLFCGDLILMHRVGRTDFLGGSSEDIVNSVRGLYDLLPDETRLYPGHGEFSNIGYEKTANECVTLDHVNLLY